MYRLSIYRYFVSERNVQGIRRRYGDNSVQAEGAVKFLKEVVPQVISCHTNYSINVSFLCVDITSINHCRKDGEWIIQNGSEPQTIPVCSVTNRRISPGC